MRHVKTIQKIQQHSVAGPCFEKAVAIADIISKLSNEDQFYGDLFFYLHKMLMTCMNIEAYKLPEKLKEMILETNNKYVDQDWIPYFEAYN